MASARSDNAEVDETWRLLSQYCLGLPTILRQILEEFSSNQLIQLSLVNKLWNYEARSIMRERGNVTGSPSICRVYGQFPCQKLVAFASDLEKMDVVPYNRLHLDIYHDGVCKFLSNENLSSSFSVIVDQAPWKRFSVTFCGDWNKSKDCPVVLLAKMFLERHCGVLEELLLGYAIEELLQPIFQDRSMPCLKSLTIESGFPPHDVLPSTFIKVLVSRAPNLQELIVESGVDLMVNVLQGSSVVLVPKFRFNPLEKPICEGLIKHLRANEMEILLEDNRTNPELLNRFVPMSLEASRTTLTELRMDLLVAVPLMCYNICLENVTTLQINITSEILEYNQQSILNLPTGLDFTRLFPKLNKVKIWDIAYLDYSQDMVSAFVERGKAVFSRALPDRAINIKILEIDDDYVSSVQAPTVRLLARMFPNVKKLHTKASQRLSFDLLREHFPCLEKVDERTWERVSQLNV